MDGTPHASGSSEAARQPTRSIRRSQLLLSREGSARRLVAAIPVCVFLSVLIVFSAFSRFMHEQEDERIRMASELTAGEVSRRLEDYVRQRVDLLDNMKDAWVSGHVRDEDDFRAHAADTQRYLTGIVALNWIDSDGIIRWVEPDEKNRAARGRDLTRHTIAGAVLADARRSGEPRMTPPLDLYQGGRGFTVYVPVIVDGELRGYVNGAFRYASLIRTCITEDLARRHYFEIADGREILHSWSDRSDTSGAPYAASRSVRIANRNWSIEMRPTALQVDSARTWADETALVLGVIAAFVLASVSFRLARGRALLRTSRERYRNVVDDTPAFICRYRTDGTITFVNIAFARTLGMAPRDLIGTSYFDRLPDDVRAEQRAALTELQPTTPSRVHELELITPDGARSCQQWIDRALFDEHGNVVEYQSVGLDVTVARLAQEDLRRSEERFRTIFNSVADGILLFDESGELVDVNDRTCALFGFGREELLGRGVQALHVAGDGRLATWLEHTATHGHFAVPDWQTCSTDGTQWQAELELRRATIAGAPRIVAVVRDVTARAQLAEQLRQSQKMEAMGTLAGGIAHDFNNILTAIMGHAEIARMTIDRESPEGHSLEGIVAACEQATGVTRSLLTFGRRGDTQRASVDLATVVRDTLQLLRPLLPGAIEVTSEISTAEALWVDADTTQIQQVVMNLALNARDAMPNGGRLHFTVSCESSYDSAEASREWREFVVVTVGDTGMGMSDDVRRRVVEPFFTTKTRERGTGLGMSVVHGIVSGHGGSLEIESTPGVGTTVRVALPRTEGPDFQQPQSAPTTAVVLATGARAMLVEDNNQVRNLLASVLRERGFTVDGETDGVSAYERYCESGAVWDLVVLDIDLPGITGTELLRLIRETGDTTPALLISGNPEFAPDLEEFGHTRFLQKPFTMREFGAAAVELAGLATRAGSSG